jgi:hypothetical protein
MKTASLPSLRVDPELRQAAESVLREGESLSQMIESSVREAIERRRGDVASPANGAGAMAEANGAAPIQPDLRSLLSARRKRVMR